jgi:proliferating cell nuclear antigen
MSLEARINAGVWKKLVESMKELVQDVNFQCTPSGISIQAMDPAHVALVNLMLRGGGFDVFNTERNTVLGINLASMSKILKTLDGNDKLTMRHDDEDSHLTLVTAVEGKTTEYQMKLLEIDAESMGVPELEYSAIVQMSGAEFAKTCKDMAIFGDTVTVTVVTNQVKFSGQSEIGAGTVSYAATGVPPKPNATQTQATQHHAAPIHKSDGGVKKEEPGVKAEIKDEDDADDNRPLVERFAPTQTQSQGGKGKGEKEDEGVLVWAEEPVQLSFALRYFTIFSKGSVLADRVTLHLAVDQPCMVEYRVEDLGFLRFFLAPKVDTGDAQ